MAPILPVKAGSLLYFRRVFDGRKAVFCVASLATLCLLCLPIWPERETSSVELRAQEVMNTGVLLGEGTQGIEASSADASATPESPTPKTPKNMKLTVPKLGLEEVAVPTGFRQAELDREGGLRLKESGLPGGGGGTTA